jgi:signal transduction histidine kinase
VKAPALADGAVDLPWLAPCAASLVALVRAPSQGFWPQVRSDPGLVLLLLRHSEADGSRTTSPFVRNSRLFESALQFLGQPGFVDWNEAGLFPIYRTCWLQAQVAERLARRLEDCDAESAWTGGLLAPLGWLAATAVEGAAVAACLAHADFPLRAGLLQQQLWGLDHTAIARRLCRRWHLPSWLGAIVGSLALPAGIAQSLGADRRLFQVVQLACALVQEHDLGLGLIVGGSSVELRAELGLAPGSVEEIVEQTLNRPLPARPPISPWQAPAEVSLLPDYLRLACEHQSRHDRPLVERLQGEVDQLQRALEEQCGTEKERLATLKLNAVAELAAGASHEINNPLAVISGQAQYLLSHETEPDRTKSLQKIVGQAQRIHQILNDLMNFARPAPPQKQAVQPGELVGAVVESLRSLAASRQVQLLCPEAPATSGHILGDAAQLKMALVALLRNAVEAAPAEGWASLRLQPAGDDLEFVVEDNGPGPTPAAREHMFDPFYSGRSAGRGRGLGLTMAWRLARQNGGDVRFEAIDHGPTRFVLRLPLASRATNGSGPSPEANGVNGCHRPTPSLS